MDQIDILKKWCVNCVLARWNPALGLSIIDSFNYSDDLTILVKKVFNSIAVIIEPSSNPQNNKLTITIPLKLQNLLVRAYLEPDITDSTSQNSDLKLILLIISDQYPESQLGEFDSLLKKMIPQDTNNIKLNFEQFQSELVSIINTQINKTIENWDLKVAHDDQYSLTTAINDFKKGIQYFQSKNWKTAYSFLQKAYIKFQEEQQSPLIMEVGYLLAVLFSQMNQYSIAISYLEDLLPLASSHQNMKYLEMGHFMKGFCSYKLDNSTFVNKIRYFSLYARSLGKVNNHTQAIEYFQKAKEAIKSESESESNLKQIAQIEYEAAFQYYYLSITFVTNQSRHDLSQFLYNIDLSILKLLNAAKIWEQLKDESLLLDIYPLIASFYGVLKNSFAELKYLNLASEKADLLNNLTAKINIVNRIIQLNEKHNDYESIISIIENLLLQFKEYVFMDFFSIGQYYVILGNAYQKTNEIDIGLTYFLKAEKVFHQISNPITEQLSCLEKIKEIYEIKKDKKLVEEYRKKMEVYKQILSQYRPKIPFSLGILRDFWIFHSDGLELFSYTPNISIEPTLFVGFVMALENISQELSQKNLESFVIGDARFISYTEPENKLFILGRINLRDSEKTAINIMKIIYTKFYEEFKKILISFSGEMTPFQRFKKILGELDLNLIQ